MRRFEAFIGGAQERTSDSHEIGAERKGFRNVEARTNAAARDKRVGGRDRTRIDESLGRWYAPACKGTRDSRSPRFCNAVALDFAPRRSPGPSDVDGGNAGIKERAHRIGSNSPTDLLDDDWKTGAIAEMCDTLEQAAETRVAFGLQRFLQRIEMKGERIGVQHFDQAPALRDAITLIELHGTEIGQERDVGRQRTNVERFDRAGRLDQRATRSKAHCESVLLCDASESPVEPTRSARTARHARYEKRRSKSPAEKFGRRIDVGEIDLRQSAVRKLVDIETGAHALTADIALEIDPEMLRLSRRRRVLRLLFAQRNGQLLRRWLYRGVRRDDAKRQRLDAIGAARPRDRKRPPPH